MLWTGFPEECVCGGRHSCALFTFREVNYCRRCVPRREGRSPLRRLLFGAVFCSWSVKLCWESFVLNVEAV